MKTVLTAAAVALTLAATSASAMFSLSSDRALETFLGRYDIAADPGEVTPDQRVQLSFIDTSADMSEQAVKAQILSVLGDSAMAMDMIDREVMGSLQTLLDRHGFDDVTAGDLSTQQQVQLSFVDNTSAMTDGEIEAEIRSIVGR